MNFLLDIGMIPGETFLEEAKYIIEILGTALLCVVSVLVFLWLTKTVYSFLFKRKGSAPSAKSSSASESTPGQTHQNTNEEIVAVIAAAIAMAESESNNGAKFRVVSFKRK